MHSQSDGHNKISSKMCYGCTPLIKKVTADMESMKIRIDQNMFQFGTDSRWS